MILGNPVIWLLGLSVVLLVVGVLGIVFATRHDRQREQLDGAGSATPWGPGLALVPELRAEINRLRQETDRLRGERDEMLRALARLAELLEGVGGGPRPGPERATRQPRTSASDLLEVEATARRRLDRDRPSVLPSEGQPDPRERAGTSSWEARA